MTSQATQQNANRVQQTLHEAAKTQQIYRPVTGVHPRVELPDDDHEAWLEGNHDVEYVVINFSDAKTVIERDGDLQTVLEPYQVPVILGTEHDEVVNNRTIQAVIDLLRIVQPAIYVPDVVYNYRWMCEQRQAYAIDAYLNHLRNLQELIIEHDLEIRLLPTNKGWKREHFEDYQELFTDYDYDEFAFYAVQYTGGDAGNASRKLRDHIRNLISAVDPTNVFVIGRLAETDLVDFDPRVGGATGLRQWTAACTIGSQLSQDPWAAFQHRREQKLAVNDDQQQQRLTNIDIQQEEL